jgi:hypothetical protein
MVYEPTLLEAETREAYLARFRRVNRPAWTFLSDDEWAQLDHYFLLAGQAQAAHRQ